MALQIVHGAFRENIRDPSKITAERLKAIEEKGIILAKDLAKNLGVTVGAISQWSNKKVQEEVLVWCDEYGQIFSDNRELKKAKHSGKAYVRISEGYTPVNATGLPSRFGLTGDPKWHEGGELHSKYDLELKIKTQSP